MGTLNSIALWSEMGMSRPERLEGAVLAHKAKLMASVMGGEVDMLCEVEAIQQGHKVSGKSTSIRVHINVKVP